MKLPCDGFNVSFENFCLETSPCRNCHITCPFEVELEKLSDALSELQLSFSKLFYIEDED